MKTGTVKSNLDKIASLGGVVDYNFSKEIDCDFAIIVNNKPCFLYTEESRCPDNDDSYVLSDSFCSYDIFEMAMPFSGDLLGTIGKSKSGLELMFSHSGDMVICYSTKNDLSFFSFKRNKWFDLECQYTHQ